MKRTHALTPVERAILVHQWKQGGVSSRIHALIGEDSDRLVSGAGKVMYVVLGACAAAGLDHDEPDLRVLRGAVNALGEQAGEPEVQEARRASIVSGLHACDRLLPRLTQRALADAALDLDMRLKRGDVKFADFERLVEALQA